MISNITIKNIKGFGDPPKSFDLEIKSNRVNLIMAPNGTGKSSIAAAFRSLLPHSLAVSKEDKYHKDEALPSMLSITLDGNTLAADASSNTISPELTCSVIDCNLSVSTTHKNVGGRYSQVSGYLDIENIIIKDRIPDEVRLSFPIADIRSRFGVNGKLLPNNRIFTTDRELWLILERNAYIFNLFPTARKRQNLIEAILGSINNIKGTAEQVKASINDDCFDAIESEPLYQNIVSVLGTYTHELSKLDKFIFFYELMEFWSINKGEIKKANDRTKYNHLKMYFDRNLSLLDITWKGIHTEESDGKLIVSFPHADEISNGQRDILTFVIELLKFKLSIKEGMKYLLIIDEVFDYIDDANTIAAQYFLTNLLEEFKNSDLYLCILTHLNPYTFKNYIFPDGKVNHIYLQNTVPAATPAMKAFIAFRESLKKDDAVQKQLYDDLSHNLFHHNPVQVDYSTRIQSIGGLRDLKPTWGRTEVLHTELMKQVNNYLSGNPQYDPYAVSLAIRLRVEKCAYRLLDTDNKRTAFIEEHMTKNKFKYCESVGVELPEILNIVNAIHNEADHLKFNAEQDRYIEKPMVYKLQHNVIKTMVGMIFEWRGLLLTNESID